MYCSTNVRKSSIPRPWYHSCASGVCGRRSAVRPMSGQCTACPAGHVRDRVARPRPCRRFRFPRPPPGMRPLGEVSSSVHATAACTARCMGLPGSSNRGTVCSEITNGRLSAFHNLVSSETNRAPARGPCGPSWCLRRGGARPTKEPSPFLGAPTASARSLPPGFHSISKYSTPIGIPS